MECLQAEWTNQQFALWIIISKSLPLTVADISQLFCFLCESLVLFSIRKQTQKLSIVLFFTFEGKDIGRKRSQKDVSMQHLSIKKQEDTNITNLSSGSLCNLLSNYRLLFPSESAGVHWRRSEQWWITARCSWSDRIQLMLNSVCIACDRLRSRAFISGFPPLYCSVQECSFLAEFETVKEIFCCDSDSDQIRRQWESRRGSKSFLLRASWFFWRMSELILKRGVGSVYRLSSAAHLPNLGN